MSSNDVEYLKKSPLFNLSLAGKELFHSEMLAWILEQTLEGRTGEDSFVNCCKTIENVVKNTFKKDLNDFHLKKVLREHQHLDIILVYEKVNSKKIVVIENKFKSLPTKTQLEKYSVKKLEIDGSDVEFSNVLKLVYSPRNFRIGIKGVKDWKFLSYEDVLSRIQSSLQMSYKMNLLLDYKKFTNGILNLMGVKKVYFPIHPKKEPLLENLERVRFADVYQKIYFSKLANFLWNANDFSKGVVNSGFSNKSGLAEIKFINENYAYGIQLQRNQIRVLVESYKDGKPSKKKVCYSDNLNSITLEKLSDKLKNKFENTGLSKNVNKYGDSFKYKYFKVKSGISLNVYELKDVSRLIIEQMKNKGLI